MVLLERANDLSLRIAKYSRLKNSVLEAKPFETRATQFTNISEKLVLTRDRLERLSEVGIDVGFIPKDGEALVSKAVILREALRTNPKVLNDPPFNLRFDFTDRLLGITTAADAEMLAAWRSFIHDNSDSTSTEILDALYAVPQYRPIVSKIRACQTQLETLASSVPNELKIATDQLRAIVQTHRLAWAEMTTGGIPDPVVSFLRDCAADGAMLAGLTEEVWGWLENRNLLNSFRIKIK
ncbi:hypothetical protein [Pseudomonas viridiflava]|uniref:hypothetical protein n=1 Tax=Pseudomonas viridiflava TaxID=33069 RepID=UPI000F0437EC|nr:hypothetical protein [Pseudomonas viridiflava]